MNQMIFVALQQRKRKIIKIVISDMRQIVNLDVIQNKLDKKVNYQLLYTN